MIHFPTGINITTVEHSSFLHIEADPEQSILNVCQEWCVTDQSSLINEWQPILFADSDVTEMPANDDGLVSLILARSDYKTRLEKDALLLLPEPPYRHNIARFNQIDRTSGNAPVTLFASGITLSDIEESCILSYIQDLDDAILGAVLGKINRGKKKMIAKYHPIIMADASVTTMPATEDGLINMIIARADYQRLGG